MVPIFGVGEGHSGEARIMEELCAVIFYTVIRLLVGDCRHYSVPAKFPTGLFTSFMLLFLDPRVVHCHDSFNGHIVDAFSCQLFRSVLLLPEGGDGIPVVRVLFCRLRPFSWWWCGRLRSEIYSDLWSLYEIIILKFLYYTVIFLDSWAKFTYCVSNS